jgi:hypothetical protein
MGILGADSGQETADSGHQTADSRRQTAERRREGRGGNEREVEGL